MQRVMCVPRDECLCRGSEGAAGSEERKRGYRWREEAGVGVGAPVAGEWD